MLLLAAMATAGDWTSAMAVGDCAGVVAALPAPEGDVERLAAARCLEKLGEDGRAAEMAAGVEGALRPYARLVRARALLDRDDATGAAAAMEGIELPGEEDELLRGRALVQSGRSEEAKEGLRKLLDGPAGAEARWWLARGAEDRGDRAAALVTYSALWSKNPTSPFAEKAAERLAALRSPVPDFTTAEGRELATTRAKALLSARLATDAVPLLDGCHAQAPYTTASARRIMAGALFDAKQYGRAVEWYTLAGMEDAASSTWFKLALATARAGNYDRAAELYAELVRRFPTSGEADEASFKPGYMHHDAGELDAAIAGFSAYLAKYPNGAFAADARWFSAWDHFRQGREQEARAGFDAVIEKHGSTELAAAARYWKARDDASLREVLRAHPESAYAWFASQRLGERYPAAAAAAPPAFPAGWLEERAPAATGIRLARAGMADWARPLLLPYVKEARESAATALPMAWALIDAEAYKPAQTLACPHKSAPAGREACLPRPHRRVVNDAALAHGLDPLLPYAIMTAESGLDPTVTSPAGARGLMQLMPRLAGDLARERLSGFVADDLYRAGTNAFLGTTELGLLHGRFARGAVQPSLPLVIAGYNGGADAVERWLGTYRTAPDADRFAEDISFTETRRYVRRVLGYLQSYRRVYGDAT